MRSGSVYFIQGSRGGQVKIGFTFDIERRLRELQTGNPDRLVVRYAMPATEGEERSLHRDLAYYRSRGEWFDPYVLKLVKRARLLRSDGRCDLSAVAAMDMEPFSVDSKVADVFYDEQEVAA